MKKSFIFFLTIFAFQSVNGQTIVGTVDDKKEGLPFATIKLFKDSNLIATATADVDGKFQFKDVGSGNFKLISSYVGCKDDTTKIRLTNDKKHHIKVKLVCQGIICIEESIEPVKKTKDKRSKK